MTQPIAEQERAVEQAFVDEVYDRLDDSARAAQELAREGYARASLGHEGGLVERDAMVFQAARRIAALDAAHEGLVFGRLDLTDGDARYIGRIGLRDAEREVLLVDWRAPAASVFYRATAQDPLGVVRRRVLRSRGRTVTGVEDELLDAGAAPEGMPVVGDGALMAQLSRARDAYMHSVVATIQKEQDEAIRSPARGVTTIGGGPGTGKTVVALHRAAYLLYTERRRFESGGVLVVGPSSVFMNYIERVLPSLGETSVTLRAVGGVVDGIDSTRHDPPPVAVLKGSGRMRRVLSRAARDVVPDAPEEFRVFWRDEVLVLDRRDLAAVRRQLLGGGQQRNRSVSRVEQTLLDLLWSRVEGERGLERGHDDFVQHMRGDGPVGEFARRWWPPLDAVEVWQWLHQGDRLRRYASGVLGRDEVETLLAAWAERPDLSIEDVPLVDELRYLLGDPPARREEYHDDGAEIDGVSDSLNALLAAAPRQQMSFERDDAEVRRLRATTRTEDDAYAHVLVDEAQDLSPMQWRMLGRRGRYSSWTIVGDPAQSAWPLPAEAAQARDEALAGKDQHAFRLSTNYRNSAEVFELAARVAQVAVPDPDLPEAVRRTGVDPVHRVTPDVHDAVVEAVAEMAAAVTGSVAVVVPVGRRAEIEAALEGSAAGSAAEGAAGRAGADRLRVLEPWDTKGLEFDGVIVVDPDEVVAESESGWRTLYVVLTRATSRVVTVGRTDRWREHVDARR